MQSIRKILARFSGQPCPRTPNRLLFRNELCRTRPRTSAKPAGQKNQERVLQSSQRTPPVAYHDSVRGLRLRIECTGIEFIRSTDLGGTPGGRTIGVGGVAEFYSLVNYATWILVAR